MNKKRGFALIEAIFMIVFLSVALLLVYKAFATSFQDEKKRVNYDNTDTIYKAYFLKQYFEENGLLDYLTTVTLNNGYLEISCTTLATVNDEYCNFLASYNFNVTKMYITKMDMSGISYANLDATTIDYMKTLSSKDTASYRFIVWYGDNEYASLKIGDPFFNVRFYLDGGTWDGIGSQRLITGDTITVSEPTKEGYIFAGWNVIGTGSTLINNVLTMGTEDVSLVATWTTPTYTFTYTGSYQLFTVPITGYYDVELYGAQGGSNVGMEGTVAGNVGGLGGYNKGTIYLNKNEQLYIYVGGQGQYASSAGLESTKGYNGGGIAGYEPGCGTSCMKGAAGGGGATDIRYFGSTTPTSSELLWNSSLGLRSRIMTAGAGGGAMNWSSPKQGGGGGGLIGVQGKEYNASTNSYTNAQGGTQIAGGAAGVGSSSASPGTFGGGGNAYITYGGGGGGGYYGGGGGAVNSSVVGSGAGGSSFISGYAGSNAITSSSSTTATNNTIHYSNKYFINSKMVPGINTGNGSAKITYISETAPARINTTLNNVRYIKDCINGSTANTGNHWVELQAIYNGTNVAKGKTVTGTAAQDASYPYTRIVDGDITAANHAYTASTGLQCLTVDLAQAYNLDEIAVWHYWADGRTYYSNTTYASSDNSTWTTIIANTEPETSQGKRASAYYINYNYTGSVQTFTVPYTGYYQLEVWGAQGGYGYNATNGRGGFGGYSNGTLYLSAASTLYVVVGGQGNGSTSTTVDYVGGYNGGGASRHWDGNNIYNASGGGATHIATNTGLLSTLSSNQSSILIVAGGGGGSSSDASSYVLGGAGGGMNGVNGTVSPNSDGSVGLGGTQTAGGSYVLYSRTAPTAGSFGAGGSYSSVGGAGGGAGFYGGGGASVWMSAGGGSGYIGNSSLINKAMYCYNCTTSSDASTLTYSTTNVSGAATGNYAKSGHGAAKITYLGS